MNYLTNAVPTHIITGFLGAGKTTLLQHLLSQKPEHERWAVLMNEFGEIGIDQHFLTQTDDIQVKEVLGGCLCCTSQLPMNIALSRLLQEYRPDRLWIEPSGLGHPLQLLEQFSEPHWRPTLALQGLVLVINGSLLHHHVWVKQHLTDDLMQHAQIKVISHRDKMTAVDNAVLAELKQQEMMLNSRWLMSSGTEIDYRELLIPYDYPTTMIKQPLLTLRATPTTADNHATPMTEIKTLPYHYQHSRQGVHIVGWKFSKSWQFSADGLMDLFSGVDYLRLKAIFNTEQGWLQFNFNPDVFNYKSTSEQIDQRLEIIYQNEQDWRAFEENLLACRLK